MWSRVQRGTVKIKLLSWFAWLYCTFYSNILSNNWFWYLSATLCPSSTLISWEYRVIRGGSHKNSSSGMDQKYRPERCWGEAQVSRSSSLFSLRSHSNSQLQWRGFPPKDSAKEEEVMIPDVARTWGETMIVINKKRKEFNSCLV